MTNIVQHPFELENVVVIGKNVGTFGPELEEYIKRIENCKAYKIVVKESSRRIRLLMDEEVANEESKLTKPIHKTLNLYHYTKIQRRATCELFAIDSCQVRLLLM